MDKSKVGERLRALATDSPNRPDAARLRDIFDEVEVTLKAKVPQAEVLAELHKLGFTMKIGSFKSAIQRIRKERKKEGGEPQNAPQEAEAIIETKIVGEKSVAAQKVPTIEEMKESSRNFDIDPTKFD